MTQRTIAEPSPKAKPWDKVPPLHAGDRLSRFEFEQRYEAHPEIKVAELIDGVVYMPSPARFPEHAEPHAQMVTWLGIYAAATPGVPLGDNATVRLDLETEVQPDGLLRLEPELGGKSRVTEDHYLEGPPELVVEIAASSVSYDLHVKRRAYQRSGVEEYIAAQMYERRLDWFHLREGVYQPLQPDTSGLLCSEVFPGLCLDPAAFWAGDMARVLAMLQDKLASPEHATFMASLPEDMKTAGAHSALGTGYADGKSRQFRLLILSNCSLSQPMTSRRNRPTMMGRIFSLRTAVVSS